MKRYEIDLGAVKTYWDFYKALQKGLELPAWCGMNRNAIWDMLTGYCEYPAQIIVTGGEGLPRDLQDEYERLLNVLNDLRREYPQDRFEVLILKA